MSQAQGTVRGTPSRGSSHQNSQAQARNPIHTMPSFQGSPASRIPMPPAHERPYEGGAAQSEAGGSMMSTSRQKQTKKDDVRVFCQRLMEHQVH